MGRRVLAVTLVSGLSMASVAFAQQATPAKPTIDDLYVDFAVPDVAALGLFGVNPSKVARPGNLKEFSLAILPLSAADANIGAGVAVSWAPVYTFAKSLDDYSGGVARRLAFSLATTKDSKSTAVSLAAGARVILHDGSDPLLDKKFNDAVSLILSASLQANEVRDAFWNDGMFSSVLNEVVGRMTPDAIKQAELKLAFMDDPWDILSAPARLDDSVQVTRFQKAITQRADRAHGIADVDVASVPALTVSVESLARKYVAAVNGAPLPPATSKAKLTALRNKYLQEHWQAPVASIDVGELLTSSSGVWGDLRMQKAGLSFSAALPAGKSGQFVLQVQERKGLGDTPDERWFYSGGGRLLLGSATKRVSVEGVFSKACDVDPKKDGVTKRLTIGTEFKLSQGFWLEIATGSEWLPAKAGQHGASLISLASLNYAFKTSSRFTQMPGADASDQ